MNKQKLYLALLTVYENNFRVLHWKASGKHFLSEHNKYSDYYEKLGEYMDETAEQLLSMGEDPINAYNAINYLREDDSVHATLVNPDDDFCPVKATQAAVEMFNTLYDISLELATDDDLPADVSDVYMAHVRYYRIEGKYKMTRQLIDKRPDHPPHEHHEIEHDDEDDDD